MSYTLTTPTGKEFSATSSTVGPVKLKAPVSGAEWYVTIEGVAIGLSEREAQGFADWKQLQGKGTRRQVFRGYYAEQNYQGKGAGGY